MTSRRAEAVMEAARGKRAVLTESRAVAEVRACPRSALATRPFGRRARQLEARVEELSEQVESVTLDHAAAVAGAAGRLARAACGIAHAAHAARHGRDGAVP